MIDEFALIEIERRFRALEEAWELAGFRLAAQVERERERAEKADEGGRHAAAEEANELADEIEWESVQVDRAMEAVEADLQKLLACVRGRRVLVRAAS
jgi:hypothetical protein